MGSGRWGWARDRDGGVTFIRWQKATELISFTYYWPTDNEATRCQFLKSRFRQLQCYRYYKAVITVLGEQKMAAIHSLAYHLYLDITDTLNCVLTNCRRYLSVWGWVGAKITVCRVCRDELAVVSNCWLLTPQDLSNLKTANLFLHGY